MPVATDQADAPKWRRSIRAAQGAVQRALHPWRRHSAVERLRRYPVASILVICNGNICRSPFAERLLARALPAVRITSAGFVGPGRPVPESGLIAAAFRGVDLSDHRSQLVRSALVFDANLIVVMDAWQRTAICRRFGRWASDVLLLGDCDPNHPEGRAVVDPVQEPLAVFHACYARIESCVTTLADAVTGVRSGLDSAAAAGERVL
ncbi:MAG TPA: hypothetical protein VGI83_04205 [Gemmatimonadales bacterium]